MEHSIVTIIAGIGILAFLCQALAWWLKLPAILFLLLSGLLVGPVLNWVNPAAIFGDLLFPFISLSVAIILFEGSLTLKLEEIRGSESVVRRMVSEGMLVTWLVIAVAAHWIVDFTWPMAFLFGAITVVTGPTVIVPMLRTVRPNSKIANILRWEGIIIDPLGALLAVLVFEFIISGRGGVALGHTLLVFGEIILIGVALGIAGGYSLGIILRRHLLPEYLHNISTLALLFGLYVLSNLLIEESGLLTVTIMGIWLANMKDVNVEEILGFKESLSLLLISVLFIVLAARMEFSEFEALGWAAIGVFLVIQFIARPLKVLVSTWGTDLNIRERALLSWIAPRGIVAAAVSALFAIRLQENGFEQASLLVPMTFIVIIGTVVLQSGTARMLANLLGVAEPEPTGFLLVGANPIARLLGKALQEHGFFVLLADSSWDNISAARMDGLKTFYGNPVSEYADRHLNLVGLGRLLALSPRDELNALACLRYRPEFGGDAIYSLASSGDETMTARHHGKILFGKDDNYAKLASLISQGMEIRSTTLTDDFDFEAWRAKNAADAIPVFAISPKHNIRMFIIDEEGLKPGTGWTIVSLMQRQVDNGEIVDTAHSS